MWYRIWIIWISYYFFKEFQSFCNSYRFFAKYSTRNKCVIILPAIKELLNSNNNLIYIENKEKNGKKFFPMFGLSEGQKRNEGEENLSTFFSGPLNSFRTRRDLKKMFGVRKRELWNFLLFFHFFFFTPIFFPVFTIFFSCKIFHNFFVTTFRRKSCLDMFLMYINIFMHMCKHTKLYV